MTKRKNPPTSAEAFKSITEDQLRAIYKKIIDALRLIGEGSQEDIAAKAKVDREKIWKRLSELHNMGFIYRPGNTRVLRSGRKGYTWMLTEAGIQKTTFEKSMPGKSVSDFSKAISRVQTTLF